MNTQLSSLSGIVFRGGGSVWSEVQTVKAERGIFQVLLGAVQPIPAEVFTDSPNRYLEIDIDSPLNDPPMSPRQRLVTVAYAFLAEEAVHSKEADRAKHADTATTAQTAITALTAETARIADISRDVFDNSITTPKITDEAVTTDKIKDTAVSPQKLSDEVHQMFISVSTHPETQGHLVLPGSAPVISASIPDGKITLANDTHVVGTISADTIAIGDNTVTIGGTQFAGYSIDITDGDGYIRTTTSDKNLYIDSWGQLGLNTGTGRPVKIGRRYGKLDIVSESIHLSHYGAPLQDGNREGPVIRTTFADADLTITCVGSGNLYLNTLNGDLNYTGNTIIGRKNTTTIIRGPLRIEGNNIQDSNGTTRLTIGTNNTISGDATITGDLTVNGSIFGSVDTRQIRDADGDTKIQVEKSADEDKIRFDTAGTERMIIDNNGNIGIGTINPQDKLDVSQIIRITGANRNWRLMSHASDGNLYIRDETAGQHRVTMNTTGNVGIGTPSPAQALTIGDSRNIQIGATDGSGGSLFFRRINSQAAPTIPANGAGVYYNFDGGTSERMVFNLAGNERVVFRAGGNVGIGTTSPIEKLDVTESDEANKDSTLLLRNLRIPSAERGYLAPLGQIDFMGKDAHTQDILYARIKAIMTYGYNPNADIVFYTMYQPGATPNFAERMRITANGNVGIGVTNPAYKTEIYDSNASGVDLLSLANFTNTNGAYVGITSRFRDDTNLSWHTPAYIRFNRRANWTGDITFHTAPSYDYRSGIERMRITKEGNTEISGNLTIGGNLASWGTEGAGKAVSNGNRINLAPDTSYRCYLGINRDIDSSQSGRGFFFWDGTNGAIKVYAKSYGYCSSTTTTPSATDQELLNIIDYEVSKPILTTEQQKDGLPEDMEKFAKDISEISVAAGILTLRMYEKMKVLEQEVVSLNTRVKTLEEK